MNGRERGRYSTTWCSDSHSVSSTGRSTRIAAAASAGASISHGVALRLNAFVMPIGEGLGSRGFACDDWGLCALSTEEQLFEGLHHLVGLDLAEQRLLRVLRPHYPGEVGG